MQSLTLISFCGQINHDFIQGYITNELKSLSSEQNGTTYIRKSQTDNIMKLCSLSKPQHFTHKGDYTNYLIIMSSDQKYGSVQSYQYTIIQ